MKKGELKDIATSTHHKVGKIRGLLDEDIERSDMGMEERRKQADELLQEIEDSTRQVLEEGDSNRED